jgi:hypothetical protein
MIPAWFPWIFVGGSLFIAMSFIGTKYKDREYKNIQFLQDFISGSIFVAFMGVLIPDMFPKFEIPSMSMDMSGGNDFDLQIGPPRLIGR